ncbi:MAG: hypothetical protein HKP31_08175 [Nitrosopumilus sp.]|nr:hypothetical protein [Nitrosopumilus sp.]
MGKEQLNLRIASSDLALLTEIANDMNLSVGTLGSKVITDFVQFYYYKIQRGDITLSKPILKKLFEAIDPSKTDEIAEYVSQYVFSEIKAQVGTVTYKILVEHFLKWNKGNHLLFNKLPQKDSDLFIS